MRFPGVLVLVLFAVIMAAVPVPAETLGNPQTHWLLIESPAIRLTDKLQWSDTLGPEKTAVFMSGSERVSFEEYCRLIGWDDWLNSLQEDRTTDLSRQKKTAELVLSAASGTVAATSFSSNPPLALALTALSAWSLVHGVWGYPEADRSFVAPPRTWKDLIEASQ